MMLGVSRAAIAVPIRLELCSVQDPVKQLDVIAWEDMVIGLWVLLLDRLSIDTQVLSTTAGTLALGKPWLGSSQ